MAVGVSRRPPGPTTSGRAEGAVVALASVVALEVAGSAGSALRTLVATPGVSAAVGSAGALEATTLETARACTEFASLGTGAVRVARKATAAIPTANAAPTASSKPRNFGEFTGASVLLGAVVAPAVPPSA